MPIPLRSIIARSIPHTRSIHRKAPNPPRRTPPSIFESLVRLCSTGQLREAINTVLVLSRKGIYFDADTVVFLLKECTDCKAFEEGTWLHSYLGATGRKYPHTLVCNHLIDMYFKFGSHYLAGKVFDTMLYKNLYTWNSTLAGYAKLGMLDAARSLFDKMPQRDVVSWNSMVIGYAQEGKCDEALELYARLRREPIELNAYSFAGVVVASMKLKDVRLARQAHCQTLVFGYSENVVLSSSILDAYAKCGEKGDVRRMFAEMPVKDVVAWTLLVSSYASWGDMVSAKEVFDLMPIKNGYSWTALISGYAQNGLTHKSLQVFRKMLLSNVPPVQHTFTSCLSACGDITSIKHGKQIHGFMITTGLRPNLVVCSSLLDMYSRCGSLDYCKRVFNCADVKTDVVLWNPMISALAQHGYGKEAIKCFNDMLEFGAKPNRITFVVLLGACSHSGLVEEGLSFFKSMALEHEIVPDEEHVACLIDLLGRAGCFVELIDQLEKVSYKADDRIWKSLVGVCSIHGNLELGKKTAEQLIEKEPQSAGSYILLSSIYAASGNWEEVQKVRQLMEERCVNKEQAISWIAIQDKFLSCAS